MVSLDTSAIASNLQTEILKKMSCSERLKAAIQLSELTRKLALARIAQEHPGLSRTELVKKFLHCVFGESRCLSGLK